MKDNMISLDNGKTYDRVLDEGIDDNDQFLARYLELADDDLIIYWPIKMRQKRGSRH